MTQAIDSPVTGIYREGLTADIERAGVTDATGGQCPIQSVPPKSVRWTGPMPVSGFGVMAVVGDDGYLIPLWTAGDLLRACKMYWNSID